MNDAREKARRVLQGAAALGAMVQAEWDDERGECERVSVLGVPVWRRDEAGRPRLLGVRFPRWIRGPRT